MTVIWYHTTFSRYTRNDHPRQALIKKKIHPSASWWVNEFIRVTQEYGWGIASKNMGEVNLYCLKAQSKHQWYLTKSCSFEAQPPANLSHSSSNTTFREQKWGWPGSQKRHLWLLSPRSFCEGVFDILFTIDIDLAVTELFCSSSDHSCVL